MPPKIAVSPLISCCSSQVLLNLFLLLKYVIIMLLIIFTWTGKKQKLWCHVDVYVQRSTSAPKSSVRYEYHFVSLQVIIYASFTIICIPSLFYDNQILIFLKHSLLRFTKNVKDYRNYHLYTFEPAHSNGFLLLWFLRLSGGLP